MVPRPLPLCCFAQVKCVSARGLRDADWLEGTSDPYCLCEAVGKVPVHFSWHSHQRWFQFALSVLTFLSAGNLGSEPYDWPALLPQLWSTFRNMSNSTRKDCAPIAQF